MNKAYNPMIKFEDLVVGERFRCGGVGYYKSSASEAIHGNDVYEFGSTRIVEAINVRLSTMLVKEGDFVYNTWSKIYGQIEKIEQSSFRNYAKIMEPTNVKVYIKPLFRRNGKPFGKRVKIRETWATAIEPITRGYLDSLRKEAQEHLTHVTDMISFLLGEEK